VEPHTEAESVGRTSAGATAGGALGLRCRRLSSGSSTRTTGRPHISAWRVRGRSTNATRVVSDGDREEDRTRSTCCLDSDAVRWAGAGSMYVAGHMAGAGCFPTPVPRTTTAGQKPGPHVDQWPMQELDREVLAAIAGDVLTPKLVEEVVEAARAMFEASNRPDDQEARRRELKALEREQGRLTEAIAAGADVPVLVERLKATEAKRRELVSSLDGATARTRPAWREIERRMRRGLANWRSLLTGDVPQVRNRFRELLTGPIIFTPFIKDGRKGIRFEGRVGLAAILGGELVTNVASPTGADDLWNVAIDVDLVDCPNS
jgi:hypothetical protein